MDCSIPSNLPFPQQLRQWLHSTVTRMVRVPFCRLSIKIPSCYVFWDTHLLNLIPWERGGKEGSSTKLYPMLWRTPRSLDWTDGRDGRCHKPSPASQLVLLVIKPSGQQLACSLIELCPAFGACARSLTLAAAVPILLGISQNAPANRWSKTTQVAERSASVPLGRNGS